MTWTVEPVPELHGFTVEWAEEGRYYLSRQNILYHSADLRPPFAKVVVIPAPTWKQMVAGVRLAQRFLRFLVTNVVPLSGDELFVTFDKSVGVVRDGRYVELRGLERPCRILRSACAVDRHGDVYFGEYLMNEARSPIRVYRYRPGSDGLHVAHVFPAGSIKHVHGIYFDRFTGALFCLTGDHDRECSVLRTDDGFATLHSVGAGDESWRAVSMLFGEEDMTYGTDAEFRPNQIYRLDRRTHTRRSLVEVHGTVYYSKQMGDDLLFTTTAENGSELRSRSAAVWHIAPDGTAAELARFEKDMWHGTLFKFGTIHFPYASMSDQVLYFSVVGAREDNQTFRLRRARPELPTSQVPS